MLRQDGRASSGAIGLCGISSCFYPASIVCLQQPEHRIPSEINYLLVRSLCNTCASELATWDIEVNIFQFSATEQ